MILMHRRETLPLSDATVPFKRTTHLLIDIQIAGAECRGEGEGKTVEHRFVLRRWDRKTVIAVHVQFTMSVVHPKRKLNKPTETAASGQ
jgi:hypothetical protein